MDRIHNHFEGHFQALKQTEERLSAGIDACGRLLVAALKRKNKILIMGNGGSAADAQHFAAELVGRFLENRRALPAIALTNDSSILTAVGNDFGFDEIFRRQIEALAHPGDIVIGISTSGHSSNILKGLTTARELRCETVGLLGKGGGEIAEIVDLPLVVPVGETPHIQEAHITILHLLCVIIEQDMADPR